MPTLLRLALSYNTCCEKEGYPLLPSKMIFVPSLVVPPKNSHQPWPFRCLASAPNPSSTIQLHCTLSKHLFKRFREFRRLCRHQRRSYQGRHQSSKTQNHYLRELISTASSLFLRLCVNSDAVDDTYYKQIQRVVRGSSGFSVHVDMRSLFVVQYFCGGREGQFVAIEATITHWQYWLSLSIWRNILEWVLAHNWSICTLPLISNLTKIEKNWINNQPIWGLKRMIIGEPKQ